MYDCLPCKLCLFMVYETGAGEIIQIGIMQYHMYDYLHSTSKIFNLHHTVIYMRAHHLQREREIYCHVSGDIQCLPACVFKRYKRSYKWKQPMSFSSCIYKWMISLYKQCHQVIVM